MNKINVLRIIFSIFVIVFTLAFMLATPLWGLAFSEEFTLKSVQGDELYGRIKENSIDELSNILQDENVDFYDARFFSQELMNVSISENQLRDITDDFIVSYISWLKYTEKSLPRIDYLNYILSVQNYPDSNVSKEILIIAMESHYDELPFNTLSGFDMEDSLFNTSKILRQAVGIAPIISIVSFVLVLLSLFYILNLPKTKYVDPKRMIAIALSISCFLFILITIIGAIAYLIIKSKFLEILIYAIIRGLFIPYILGFCMVFALTVGFLFSANIFGRSKRKSLKSKKRSKGIKYG